MFAYDYYNAAAYDFLNDVMKKFFYNNLPFLQINIIDSSSGKYFEVFNLKEPYNGFQCDSLKDLLEYVEVHCLEEV